MAQHPLLAPIKTALVPLQDKLRNHPVYAALNTPAELMVFMNHHVYSVWDFMNLLKTLQAALTCVSVPWRPVLHPDNARLINEIVLEEESDHINGATTSHFAFYVSALQALDTGSGIGTFVGHLQAGLPYTSLIELPEVPTGAKPFLRTTFDLIQGPLVGVASAFTFGRESLIPTLFSQLVSQAAVAEDPALSTFMDYIHRHIELDGDVHSHLAETMTANLIQTPADVEVAIAAATQALAARLGLWDAIYAALKEQKP
ncbi:MAG: DUF3050 domain-containing protein [Candidatus Margulisiibacteriota bacterium]